ncbi:NEAT domain-containing protein [Lacticaseibacillus porcinae]|uniref:NEAT domain-containing protein n=1 Tax=Lacticaseibacillus porcinae TaxID=1123687 RepID=UPI000F76A74D|nr:NEAT domain-containing protein [Lacticaseibacillus porcinae]
MIKKILWTLSLVISLVAGVGVSHAVFAKAVTYQTLTYGTNKTSLAAKYYVQPAQVVINGDDYLVTMTIHTASSLGAWPVTVLSVNGVGPANVVKARDEDGYEYQYAFETHDLTQVINSDIAINVVGVYAAQHKLSFKFDQSQLPSLPQPASRQTVIKKTIKVTRSNQDQIINVNRLNAANRATQTKVLIAGGLSMVMVASLSAWWVLHKKMK